MKMLRVTEIFAQAAFFLSGFAGLLYQIVWLRVALANYGVITPILSTVLSIFMLGLSIGSFLGGAMASRAKSTSEAFRFYGAAELTIALGGITAPFLLRNGVVVLTSWEGAGSWQYLLLSGAIITLSLLPWCIAMGMTFPLVVAALSGVGVNKIFSVLYSWNVLGGIIGTLFSACIGIELFGLHATGLVGVTANTLVGVAAFLMATQIEREQGSRTSSPTLESSATKPTKTAPKERGEKVAWLILFITGLVSMAMEVIWTRAFTGIIGTTIYAFACVLVSYLIATWLGTLRFRAIAETGKVISAQGLLTAAVFSSFLPLLLSDPKLSLSPGWVLLSIGPFSAILGYLTPMLVDQIARGSSEQVGRAYALNIFGCILGPLLAGYFLLPTLGIKVSLFVLIALLAAPLALLHMPTKARPGRVLVKAITCTILLVLSLRASTLEDPDVFRTEEVRDVRVERDFVATVVSYGEGFNRILLVNGVGMTRMSSLTKFMAHLPLAMHTQNPPPRRALVICLGMGTTFRSLLSWDIESSVVELVPGVAKVLDFFFPDLPPRVDGVKRRIIIDDGRRFLRRTNEQFDLITLDPPPPIEAAGSSLLYGREFYQLAKRRLAPYGLLQQWVPADETDDRKVVRAIARAIKEEFLYVKAFRSIENWGYHFIASQEPFESFDADSLLRAMPKSAVADMMEWFPNQDPKEILATFLRNELPIDRLLDADPRVVISDDSPFNEYYLIRRMLYRLEQIE